MVYGLSGIVFLTGIVFLLEKMQAVITISSNSILKQFVMIIFCWFVARRTKQNYDKNGGKIVHKIRI